MDKDLNEDAEKFTYNQEGKLIPVEMSYEDKLVKYIKSKVTTTEEGESVIMIYDDFDDFIYNILKVCERIDPDESSGHITPDKI